MDVREWIIDWFVKKTGKSEDFVDANANENYFELEYIDSFEFIGLINDIETRFNIVFKNDQFEDRSFATISGLSDIVGELIK